MDDAWSALEPRPTATAGPVVSRSTSPWVATAPITVDGPLAGWPALLSQALVIAHFHTRESVPFRGIELFDPDAHRGAARLRVLEPRLGLETGLQALLPTLLGEVLS